MASSQSTIVGYSSNDALIYSVPDHHYQKTYAFDRLVSDIRSYLGTSSGINSKDINPEYLIALMNNYVSNRTDWLRFAGNDTSKNYTRNAIDDINGRANLLLLVWNPGKGSPIHDHADAHCIMKILAGELRETVFHTPDGDSRQNSPLTIKKETIYRPNEVAYIADDIGIHRVVNPNPNEVAISLHLYTPPNAADFGYNIYDRQTGHSCHVKQT